MPDPTVTRRTALSAAAAIPAFLSVDGVGPARGATAEKRLSATSPDGGVTVVLHDGEPAWEVIYRGQVVVARSPLALLLDKGRLGPGARLIRVKERRLSGSWSPSYGIRNSSTEACSEIACTFLDPALGATFTIIARAYDAGAAVRIRLDLAKAGKLTLVGEETEIRLPVGAILHCSRDEGEYQVAHQTDIAPVPHPDLTSSSDKGDFADVPLLAQLRDGVSIVITESDRLNYPRVMFASTRLGLVTRLMRFPGRAIGPSGPGDTEPELQFDMHIGQCTPWRLAVLAPDAKGLIERQDLVPTLATPNLLGECNWIKPGRALRIRTYTTQAGLDAVDFATMRRLDYVEWDWRWYGDGTDSSDATRPIPSIDIRHVINYARSKGIGMILYVDRVPAMRQLDAIVKTYRAWGVAGIKFGFIWEGRQADTNFITNLVKVCGEHRLLVSLHDDLRPAGLERTYPNYVALEGVRGNEHFPNATHNCTLPFTRAIAGPIDYTICFANDRNQTTNAHQLAMAAVYYNPLTFLYWYDSPEKYAGRTWPELAFFDECPTTWDETVALSGAVGEHVTVARRSGSRWFLGAMTNEQPRKIEVPLGFLGSGKWRARRFGDGIAAPAPSQTPVTISSDLVSAGQSLELILAPSGGQAVIFERA